MRPLTPDFALSLASDAAVESADRLPVLVVDDEGSVRELMSRWLGSGYIVNTAANASDALKDLEAAPAAVVVCDIRMPGHDGIWLAQQIRRLHPETAVIVASGVQDADQPLDCLKLGVVDYLTKPFGRDRLRGAVASGVEWHRAAWDARRWRESLEHELQVRQARVSDLMRGPVNGRDALEALLVTLFGRTSDAYGHSQRVAASALRLGVRLGLDEAKLHRLECGALFHDLGKLAMPDALLRKPAPLTRDEMAVVRRHPAIGGALLVQVSSLRAAADVVRDCHERMDGLGFPTGVAAANVSLSARIVHVVDAYDTMTRPRVFRDAISPSEALLELERCSGTQFDPRLVSAFIAMAPEGR